MWRVGIHRSQCNRWRSAKKTNKQTRSKVLLGVNFFSLSHPVASPHPTLNKTSPEPPTYFVVIHFSIIVNYVWVFQAVSFLELSTSKPCMPYSYAPYASQELVCQISMHLITYEMWLDSPDSGQGPVRGSCVYGCELPVFLNGQTWFDHISDYQLPKDPAGKTD